MRLKRHLTIVVSCATALSLIAGCVERNLIIRSEPPGALVTLNGVDEGITPLKKQFKTYGVYDVVLSAPEYKRLRTTLDARAPWFQQAPIDFIPEIIWPFTIHDNHEFNLKLQPASETEEQDVNKTESEIKAKVEQEMQKQGRKPAAASPAQNPEGAMPSEPSEGAAK